MTVRRKPHSCRVWKGNNRGFKGWIAKCTCGWWQGWYHKDDALGSRMRHLISSNES